MNLTAEMIRAAMDRATQKVAANPETQWYCCHESVLRGKVIVFASQAVTAPHGIHLFHPDDFAQVVRETEGMVIWKHVRELRWDATKEQFKP